MRTHPSFCSLISISKSALVPLEGLGCSDADPSLRETQSPFSKESAF